MLNVSVVNASYLGKNGAVTALFKILALCQRKHLILLKHSLDTLGHLVKSSQCYSVSHCLSLSVTEMQIVDTRQFVTADITSLRRRMSSTVTIDTSDTWLIRSCHVMRSSSFLACATRSALAPNADISLQSGRFWAASIASSRERLLDSNFLIKNAPQISCTFVCMMAGILV